MSTPVNMETSPENLWHFFQALSLFMLQGTRKPITEFFRSFGAMFPTPMSIRPTRVKTSCIRSTGTEPRSST